MLREPEGKSYSGEKREPMVKVVGEETIEMSVNILCQTDLGKSGRRCNECDLELESPHYVVACPLREMEATFLSEGWLMESSDEIINMRQMV